MTSLLYELGIVGLAHEFRRKLFHHQVLFIVFIGSNIEIKSKLSN